MAVEEVRLNIHMANPSEISLAPLAGIRSPSVAEHLSRSRYWSNHVAAIGPTALIYGALELRLGIESALMQLLLRIRGKNLDESDWKALRSAKAMQTRIYEIEGHQRILDRKLEFLAYLMAESGAPIFPLARLNVAKAFSYWRHLSDLCHLIPIWTDGTANEALELLISGEKFLEPIANALIVWPEYHDNALLELEKRFVAGDITSDEMRAAIRERGAWGLVTHSDGHKEFASDLWGETHDLGED